ncbi:MAG: ATP-binding protein [Bacillota bacterium]
MQELSLHILDIVQNSIRAQADLVTIIIREKPSANLLEIIIKDDGTGMDEQQKNRALDPFVTSRTTREVGLGLSLFKATVEACEGQFVIESSVGEGTTIKTQLEYDHIDRPPLGNMAETLISLISVNPDLDINYIHCKKDQQFLLQTKKIKEELQEVEITEKKVLKWLEEYIKEGLDSLSGGG